MFNLECLFYFLVKEKIFLSISEIYFQRVIQVNTLEDRSVHDYSQWNSALRFMSSAVQNKLEQSNLNYSLLLFGQENEFQSWEINVNKFYAFS